MGIPSSPARRMSDCRDGTGSDRSDRSEDVRVFNDVRDDAKENGENGRDETEEDVGKGDIESARLDVKEGGKGREVSGRRAGAWVSENADRSLDGVADISLEVGNYPLIQSCRATSRSTGSPSSTNR